MMDISKENEIIETAIRQLQKYPNDEMLAHALTVIRQRMKENGEFIVAVNNSITGTNLELQTISSEDGKNWFYVFTSFDEETKGSNPVMSTFTADISKLFMIALQTPTVEGIVINPWDCTLFLDKNLINIILG